MNIRKAVLAALILAPLSLAAKVGLPPYFSDNMVLQHSSSVKFFGTADAGAKVTVKASWSGKTLKTTADEKGNWRGLLNTPAPSSSPSATAASP